MPKKLVVIGGGAAGFFCAINAARLNPLLQVTLLEKSGKLLSKVKVSGGGRCNVTSACFEITEMSRRYPRGGNFVKKTFHQFFTTDTIEWFAQRGVELKTEEDGRMFPVTNSSQTVIDCLLSEASRYGVMIKLHAEVKQLRFDNASGFSIQCTDGVITGADFVCVASGGYPKTGMFEWLAALGHAIEEPVPSLFTFNLPKHPITQLMGVSVDAVKIRIAGTKMEQTGPLLITHWGLSGPAVLRLSAWGARQLAASGWRFSVLINWLPQFTGQELQEKFHRLRFEQAPQKVGSKNAFGLPNRLWEFMLHEASVKTDTRWADLSAKSQNKLIGLLQTYAADVSGKTTFKEEFVTAGGIRLNEIDPNTMMSKKVANLFFAGEVLDVDGITGGFNFQHAWTSGFIAAKSIAALSS